MISIWRHILVIFMILLDVTKNWRQFLLNILNLDMFVIFVILNIYAI